MWKRITMTLLSFLFVFVTWLVAAPLNVHACSCAELPSIEDQFNRKTAIFTGKLLSLTKPAKEKIWSSADPVKAQFEVKTVWKGDLGTQTTVYTALGSESCGYEGFEVNEEFIVFAYGKPDRLETGLCEGTKNLESAHEELKALGAGYEPSKISSPQKDQLEISSINKETNSQFIIVLVLTVSLTVFILLVLSLRSRRR